MIRETGDMFNMYGKTDNFLVTTNSYIRTDDALLMRRGAAFELAKRNPSIPYAFGRHIKQSCGDLSDYHCIILPQWDENHKVVGVGAFQVKRHYSDLADLELIKRSTEHLTYLAVHVSPHERFDINYPGIGNGGLKHNDVQPIIETLPDNVHVWTFR